MLDSIRVDYYGQTTPLGQMATVSVPEPRLLTVKPWDKSQVKLPRRRCVSPISGLNPQVDGDLIRIPIPPLSEERRKDLVKIAKKDGEECKVAVRKARHEALDMLSELKQGGDASEDEVDRARRRRSKRSWPRPWPGDRPHHSGQGKGKITRHLRGVGAACTLGSPDRGTPSQARPGVA